MPGPIISGGNPKLEALLFIALFCVFAVLISPELTSMVLNRMPWLAPVLHWLHHVLDAGHRK